MSRKRSNGFCNRRGFSRFHSWPVSSCQRPRQHEPCCSAPECRCTRTSGSTGRAGPRPSVPHASYPSGCRDVTDADMFRLVVCVRSHLDKTTTWHDPRIAQLQSAAAQRPIAGTPVHTHSLSNPAQPATQPQNNISPETGIALSLFHPLVIIQFLFKAQTCFSELQQQ